MKKLIVFVLSIVLLESCLIQRTNHSFYHHGSDSINTSSKFKYVKFNIKGKSSTTYNLKKLYDRTAGEVEAGMIADAKVDLYLNYTLKDNQAYTNLSVDVLETTKGYPNGNITEVNLEVVVSADVIEYYQ